MGEMIKELDPYNNPKSYVYIGWVTAVIQGVVFTIFGWFIIEAMFAMYPDPTKIKPDGTYDD